VGSIGGRDVGQERSHGNLTERTRYARLVVPRLLHRAWAAVPPAASALVLATGCGGGGAATPAAGASPEAVVRAYVAAEAAGDAEVLRALSTPRHWRVVRDAVDGPLRNPRSVRDLVVRPARVVRAADVPGGSRGSRQVRTVGVTYVIHQRRELTTFDGPRTWGFVLVRDDDAAPWRIDDEGVG
jgi:hypothetical protein